MKNRGLRLYILLTAAGFLTAMIIGTLIYVWFQREIEQHNRFSGETYRQYIAHVNQTTLRDMAVYIAEQFPVLRDTERLKREAGSDWFWETSRELTTLARIFGFKYIYYLEKDNETYRFLMSSGIGRDEHPEWLGGPVWSGSPPAFIEQAYESGQLTISPELTINEWGSLVSAVLPIVNNGTVTGILGVDYDVSYLTNPLLEHERNLRAREDVLRRNLWLALWVFCVVTSGIMCIQIGLAYRSVIVPIQTIEADERTRLMMDATPMICSFWDADGNMLDCNREALTIFGLSQKSDYIDHFYALNPEYQPNGRTTREMVPEFIRAALENGVERFEWMYRTAAGEPLPVETTLVRVPWKNGCRIAAYSRDLREIKAKEEAAREVEERMRLMLDTMAFACYFFDEEGEVVDCNQRAVQLYRCASKDDLLERFFTLNPERQSDGRASIVKAKELIHRAFLTGKTVFRWDHITGEGTPLPVEVTMIRVKWQNTYRVISYARDLTELTETQDNLVRISAMMNETPNPVIYLGERGDIEYTNPAVSAVSGYTREELYVYGLPLIFTNEEVRRLKGEYVERARQHWTEKYDIDISLVNKKGESLDFVFSVFAVPLHDRKIGVGLIGRNITELKRIQRDLAAAKDVAEHALVQEAHYDKAKNHFLSRVSHEMRTPMNAIIDMTGAARKSAAGAEQDYCFEAIETAANRLLDMAHNILDVTGFNTGGFDWSPAPFSFSAAMHSVIDAVTPRARAKQQNFIIDIEEGIIPDALICDEGRLQQLLTELLFNAVKFTPEGGTIGLSAHFTGVSADFNERSEFIEMSGSDCRVRFTVWDTGIGIGPKNQERIWEPFEQADSDISRNYEGLGLGLYLAKCIVELMKGTICVESDPGQGSRFICELRLGLRHKAGNNGETNALNGRNITGRRILVVDDIDINREIVFAILQDTGAELVGAENGVEAVRKFREKKCDLVFMDIRMPVLDGLAAIRQMRSSGVSWEKTTPVITLSADTSAENRIQCMEAGASDYLSKPVDPELIFQKLAQWLP
jgi:PAS domain S-box-containing protein